MSLEAFRGIPRNAIGQLRVAVERWTGNPQRPADLINTQATVLASELRTHDPRIVGSDRIAADTESVPRRSCSQPCLRSLLNESPFKLDQA